MGGQRKFIDRHTDMHGTLFVAEPDLPEIRSAPCPHPRGAVYFDTDEYKCRECGRSLSYPASAHQTDRMRPGGRK